MLVDSEDKLLTKTERRTLHTIGARLMRVKEDMRARALPETYRAELDRAFGSCCDGDR